MSKKFYQSIIVIGLFLVFPGLFYAYSGVPQQTWLKESISIITVLAFLDMIFQFYLSRANDKFWEGRKKSHMIKWHKILGYIFIGILLIHPFLVVLPRYFEPGVAPADAFMLMLGSYQTPGIFAGITAWVLMLILGLTALLRKRLPWSYKTWRIFHGLLSIAFISTAAFHVIDTGRHITTELGWFMAMLTGGGILLLLRTYVIKPSGRKKKTPLTTNEITKEIGQN
ncbi:ferric reductase-like transmembrane domain-containing protein [Thermophagus sp. OGC60D27]|uniref:ferric reductase-like transmembrane domain-containing protein n=1 Tax=Thermophagus sp. OGC60D27 TaxID=3458415 RepID=UPI004037A01D